MRRDLSGQRFGALKVLSFSHKDKCGRAYWSCECVECGHTLTVRGSSLLSGHTAGHDCEKARELEVRRLSIVGNTYGELTVISSAGTNKAGRTLFLCRCTCEEGKTCIVTGSALIAGNTKSCGHLKLAGQPNIDDVNNQHKLDHLLTGRTIGGVRVLDKTGEFTKRGGSIYRVECLKCGHTVDMHQTRLHRSKRDFKCPNCQKIQAEAAKRAAQTRPQLSDEQTRAANEGMRIAVFKTAPSLAPTITEDVVQQSWLVLLQTEGINEILPERLKVLGYSIARNLTKRHFGPPEMKLKSPPKNKDGEWEGDVFDDLDTSHRAGIYSSSEPDPLQAISLECMSEGEKDFLLGFLATKGWKPPEQRSLFETLCAKVKKAHQGLQMEMDSNSTKGENVDTAIAA